MALLLPDGRFGAALPTAGALCPCEAGEPECFWAAIFTGDDGGLGDWIDLARDWHHTTQRDARMALEREYYPADPDVSEWRKADAHA